MRTRPIPVTANILKHPTEQPDTCETRREHERLKVATVTRTATSRNHPIPVNADTFAACQTGRRKCHIREGGGIHNAGTYKSIHIHIIYIYIDMLNIHICY